MQQAYSQPRALWAITKASFKAIFANPTALFFSLVFPIIFILIFGAFGEDGQTVYRIALAPGSDTTSIFYKKGLKQSQVVRIMNYTDTIIRNEDLIKGKLTAIVTIKKAKDSLRKPQYIIRINSTTASANTLPSFIHVLDYLRLKIETALDTSKLLIKIEDSEIKEVRKYRQIDFILPGQLGFSILFSTLFGIAFLFFGLREQLVLKRFYASPVNRINILLGIGMSRLLFQLINVIVLILFGHFLLNFTLIHGAFTFIELVLLTIVMLFLLLGVGLNFSSISITDTNIPLLVNLFGFPQMMLSGTFFPVEVFPKWLQEICQALPLTQFNDAMRKISFEGLHLFDCWKQIGILGIWIVIIYAIAVRVLKWE